MRTFTKILLPVVAMVTMLSCASAQEKKDGLTWYTDIEQAAKVSNDTHRPIFGFFTGSDWCGWCHKLEADVMSKQQFKDWAAKHVVLLELDFPRKKQLPQKLQDQNNSLQQFFRVQGYPTVWIFDIAKDSANRYNITPKGSLGYSDLQTFMRTADSLSKVQPPKPDTKKK